MPFQIDPSSQYLDRQLFMSILQYEELMLDGQFNREIVENLITLYAQCVEFYDSIKDPIKFYFLEKMQIILCHEQTLKEIVTPKNKDKIKQKVEKQKNQNDQKNVIIDDDLQNEVLLLKTQNPNPALVVQTFSEIIQNSNDDDSLDEKQDDNSSYQDLDSFQEQQFIANNSSQKESKLNMHQLRLKYKQNCRIKYSISKKKLERSKRVGMYLQIHQEANVNQAETMGSLFQSFVDNNEKQANQVKQNLNEQQQEVERRLQRRKTLKEGGQNNISLAQKSTLLHTDKNKKFNQEQKIFKNEEDQENLYPDDQSIN